MGELEKNKTEYSSQEEAVEKRKKQIIEFIKKKNLLILAFIVIALILGIYIRSLPMTDHNGTPGLWDVSTNTWTLGPDLDPFLFMRYAEIIVEKGKLPKIDLMRNYPLGYNVNEETVLLPYMIAGTFYISKIFYQNANVEFAAVFFPVIMFALTIISFFLFSRELFITRLKNRANVIAIISTFFMIVIPAFLSRTIAGIPEKESAGFFFMFLGFYLFLKAWKSDNTKLSIIFGIFSGIATACMGLIWGGVIYMFVSIGAASLMAFILNLVKKKQVIAYASWIIPSFFLMSFLSDKYSLLSLTYSISSGLSLFVLSMFIIDLAIFKTSVGKIKILQKLSKKYPQNIISIVISFILIIILTSILFKPDFFIEKFQSLYESLIKPVTGRWNVTVAENRQPYFNEWAGSFGPRINNVPLFFWLFIIGSIVLFKDTLKKHKKNDSWILTALYVLFLFGLIFSRYSASSMFNGENFVSKLFYFGTAAIFFGSVIYYYVKYFKEGNDAFNKIPYEIVFVFTLFVLTLFTARSAVRLIMVLVPFAPIFLGYLISEVFEKFKKSKDELGKVVIGIFLVLILVLSLYSFYSFYTTVKIQAYNFIPSSYTQQWQKAMGWVRENTPENAIFTHWWDYGYWVQSMGKRTTTVDGGNTIVYWNYLVGRHVLTGHNETSALEFLYSHDSEYLLIDSTDIGKYSAFSSIGSDANYDRFSWIPTMNLDEKQTVETRDGNMLLYSGASRIDEDIMYKDNNSEIFLASEKSAILGIIVYTDNSFNNVQKVEGIFHDGTQQIKIPLRYLYYNGDLIDFGDGLEASFMIIQRLSQNSNGISNNPIGGGLYVSPRVFKTNFARMYLFNKTDNFELIHTEYDVVTKSLIGQGLSVGEFTFFNGLHGPIKIWKVKEFPEGIEKNPEFIQRNPPSYITWKF